MLAYCSPIIDDLFSADSTYLLLLVDDVVFNTGRVSDWHLSAHYLLCPDAIEALFAVALSKVGIPIHVAALAVFSLPPVLLLATTLQLLMRSSTSAAVAASTVAWGGLLALTDVLIASDPHLSAAWQVFAPAAHGGAFLAAWACLLILYRLVAAQHLSRKSWWLLGGTGCALVAAVVFSDLIFLPWGLAPLSVVIMWLGWRVSPVRSAAALAGLWLAAAAGGAAAVWFEHAAATAYYGAAPPGDVETSLWALLDYLARGLSFADPIRLLFLFSNAALWIAAALVVFRRPPAENGLPGSAFTLFAGSASAISVAAAVLGAVFANEYTVRYFIPYLVFGPLFIWLAAGARLWKSLPPRGRSQWLTGGAIACAGSALWFASSGRGPAALALSDCLLEEGLRVGLADYWDAGPIVTASRYQVHVVPMVPGTVLHPFRWMTKEDWLQRSARDNAPVDLRFLIARPGVEATARAVYGTPLKEIRCAGRTIYVYGPGVLDNSHMPTALPEPAKRLEGAGGLNDG